MNTNETGASKKPQIRAIDASLRDHFAAKAMAAWLSTFGATSSHPAQTDRCQLLASEAYAVADAMLKAREQ